MHVDVGRTLSVIPFSGRLSAAFAFGLYMYVRTSGRGTSEYFKILETLL